MLQVAGLRGNSEDGEKWMNIGCRDDHMCTCIGCQGKRKTLSLECSHRLRYRNLRQKEIFERMGKSKICFVYT